MKINIRHKLAFIIGILLILTLVVGLVSFFQIRFVNGKIKQIADVDHNTSVTAYLMEINVIGTSFAVLRYLHEHDSKLLSTVNKEEKEFNDFQKDYRKIIQTPRISELGNEVAKTHNKFINLSKVLINEENQQNNKIENFQSTLLELNRFLEDKIQDSIKSLDLNRYRKLKAALKMQVNANRINKNLENYLRTHDGIYKNEIVKNQNEFKTNFDLYLHYTYSDKKQQWLAFARNKFTEVAGLSNAIMDVENLKQESLQQFESVEKELVIMLEKQILILAQKDLIKAKEDALEASHKSIVIISIILSASLLFGILMSYFFTRRITRSLWKLVKLTQVVSRGDFSQKLKIVSRDEIALLGNSFNSMIDRLEDNKQKQSELFVRLKKSNDELDDFAYIVSHDLKAPLRAINNISDWIVKDCSDKLDQTGLNHLNLLKDRVKRMQELIDGILKYSRIARKDEVKENINIGLLLNETLQLINKPSHIEIKIQDAMPQLYCEKVRMEQVFSNLIGNSIKYMDKPDGLICVTCSGYKNFFKFGVSDNGPGIEEKNFEKIFQLFQTLRSSEEKESTGIGLTIVKKIIDNYGGKIWVESIPGKLTTFYFTVPKHFQDLN